jgi:hypothetical protein
MEVGRVEEVGLLVVVVVEVVVLVVVVVVSSQGCLKDDRLGTQQGK